MDHHDDLPHLSPMPLPPDTFPECLRDDVVRRAQEIYEARTALGVEGNEVGDWLAAEAEVMAAHAESPARLVPNGDLFPYELDPAALTITD